MFYLKAGMFYLKADMFYLKADMAGMFYLKVDMFYLKAGIFYLKTDISCRKAAVLYPQAEIQKDEGSQQDPVPSEGDEVMLADVSHQEADDQDGYKERRHHAHAQDHHLALGEGRKPVVRHFYQAGTEHDRHCQEERKLCCRCPGYADQQGSQDRGAGTGSPGENRRCQLEDADHKGCWICNLCHRVHFRHPVLVYQLNYDKQDTYDDQSNGYYRVIVEFLFNHISPFHL